MKICITGGGGYIGSALVPYLLKRGHQITVLDTFWFGDHLQAHDNLDKLVCDVRDVSGLDLAFKGKDAVIHLACISNDPSFDLDPGLGKSINYDAFKFIMKYVKDNYVKKFIYASSSSVYGVSDLPDVTERAECHPITDYSKFKRACEIDLMNWGLGDTQWTILRPATVCGYAPRLRLDLVVNAMTIDAVRNKRITVHGGMQKRPNINIRDMVRAYEAVLNKDCHEKTYNVGFENLTLTEIAYKILRRVNKDIKPEFQETNDKRSYHVNSDLIKEELDFEPTHTIDNAIISIENAYEMKLIDPNLGMRYFNLSLMKGLGFGKEN